MVALRKILAMVMLAMLFSSVAVIAVAQKAPKPPKPADHLREAGSLMKSADESWSAAENDPSKEAFDTAWNRYNAVKQKLDAIDYADLNKKQRKVYDKLRMDQKRGMGFSGYIGSDFEKNWPEYQEKFITFNQRYQTLSEDYDRYDAMLQVARLTEEERNQVMAGTVPEEEKELYALQEDYQRLEVDAWRREPGVSDPIANPDAIDAAVEQQDTIIEEITENFQSQAAFIDEAEEEGNLYQREPFTYALAKGYAAIADFLRSYFRFSGIAQFGALFVDDGEILLERAKVQRFFCDTIMLGGTACWSQKICEQYIEIQPGNPALISTTPSGDPRVTAHLEAQRSMPILFTVGSREELQQIFGEEAFVWINGQLLDLSDPEVQIDPTGVRMYLYKVTYGIRNPTDDDLEYNVVFETRGGQRIAWFPDNLEVEKEGGFDARRGATALTKYSANDYVMVCLIFDPPVTRFGGGKTSKLCTGVVEYTGEATTFDQEVASEQAKDQEEEPTTAPGAYV